MRPSEVPFEAPLEDLRRRIEELESYPEGSGRSKEISRLKSKLIKDTTEVYGTLSRWEKTLVARHSERPHTLDYVEHLMSDWVEVHGDRAFADDPAIVAGLARFMGRSVAVLGHQKGRATKERIHRNFGQARPEGYRKALRLMKMAERFSLPLLCFVDTPGAYPGIGAEQRGQAEAIARNLIEMAALRTPIVVTITGEGGSGGALGIAMGDRVYMLQYSVYSVISPEGCAAILWKDQNKKENAADALRLTAPDIFELGVVDAVIPEPAGAAHANPNETIQNVGGTIAAGLAEIEGQSLDKLLAARYNRFRKLGFLTES
ncbi:MAG: acetyl-CoA carboxylase carboxyltransferase subunit alpha [bacterium]|nr:acetyl-CoA carboxylase carboxyltransferase subunit alpha [bacterium]